MPRSDNVALIFLACLRREWRPIIREIRWKFFFFLIYISVADGNENIIKKKMERKKKLKTAFVIIIITRVLCARCFAGWRASFAHTSRREVQTTKQYYTEPVGISFFFLSVFNPFVNTTVRIIIGWRRYLKRLKINFYFRGETLGILTSETAERPTDGVYPSIRSPNVTISDVSGVRSMRFRASIVLLKTHALAC